MQTLTVALADRSYPIYVGAGLLDAPEFIVRHLRQNKVAVVTNTTVASMYLKRLHTSLQSAGVEILPVVVPDGEAHKNAETLDFIFDTLIEARSERKTAVLALGGGVVGDLAGFAAATYQRGVPYIQVPTTLLAQVDSAVGGKTAINHARGKNMIGAFYQPLAVVSDTDTLATLPDRELAAGVAEVVKYGIVRDARFFEWLEQHIEALNGREREPLEHAIVTSCRNKAEIVALDERESGPRATLNFGHTFGHAIEAGVGYGDWLHGEAVACGMVIAARLSQLLGLLASNDVARIVDVLRRAKLPLRRPDLGFERYLELMGHDKKVEGGKMRFIVLRAIGDSFVTADVPLSALRDALDYPLNG
jgi:3-dehydroquinate synthase